MPKKYPILSKNYTKLANKYPIAAKKSQLLPKIIQLLPKNIKFLLKNTNSCQNTQVLMKKSPILEKNAQFWQTLSKTLKEINQ